MFHRKLKWQRLPGNRNLRGRAGHSCTLVGKDIYVLGGRNGNDFFNDMWVFDTEIEQWNLLQVKTPFSPRAYHTCTLVNDHELWIIGGSDPKTMHSDVYVFDTISAKWSCPVLSGSTMKPRGTHAAVLHPTKKRSILIYGGYGGSKPSWLSDLILFHTDTLEWQELMPEGVKPIGRGYHTFTRFGNCVMLFGGKAETGIVNEEKVSIYDAENNAWNMIPVKGHPPCSRSNHAAVLLYDNLILIHGGRHGSLRLNDAYVLQVSPVSYSISNLELSWHLIEQSENPIVMKKTPRKRSLEYHSPSGRSAHTLVAKGQELYMFGGYGGEGLTFSDMFVLRKFPKLREVDARKQPLCIYEINEREDGKQDDEGWRTTKLLRLHTKKNVELSSVFDVTKLQSKHNDAGCSKETPQTPETRSTEPLNKYFCPQERTVISAEDKSLAILMQDKELYQKEVRSLQQSVESLRETIKDKTLVDPNIQQRTVQLEQDMQNLQKEKLDLQTTIGDLEKELAHQTKKFRKLEQENKTIRAHMQDLKCSLEDKENVRQAQVLKLDEYEKQLKTLGESFQESKALVDEVSLERDKYKACVDALEVELGKQMEALKQLNSRFETEKCFLMKEIEDRKLTTDKLLTDLGASKEIVKSMEASITCQTKQIEQDAIKISSLQKEMEILTCSNAVLTSENKQLLDSKGEVEATSSLLRSELQSVRMLVDQRGAEIVRLKEAITQTNEHSSTLHETLKKNEERLSKQMEECNNIRALMCETEEFELAQMRMLQAHAEKLRCARQLCSYKQQTN